MDIYLLSKAFFAVSLLISVGLLVGYMDARDRHAEKLAYLNERWERGSIFGVPLDAPNAPSWTAKTTQRVLERLFGKQGVN